MDETGCEMSRAGSRRAFSELCMMPIRLVVDTFADDGLTNAQMSNGREIIARLDPERFHVTTFVLGNADPRIQSRPNTRLVRLPQRRQTLSLLREFLLGRHDLLFYPKASPAMKWYMKMKALRGRGGLTVGTVESQMNLRDEPTITPDNVRMFEQTVLRADYLFSNSRMVARSLEKNYGRKSDVIPTGVDTDFYSPGAHPANPRPRVLFVGSLRPFKGPDIVLDAAEHFPQADFVIVGDGMMAPVLRTRAAKLANVEMKGSLAVPAVLEEYRRADVFLFPSRWEGSPKVIAEAAACGLPVIARKDYEPETVRDGLTGFLVRDNEELFARLEFLLSHPEECRSMGQRGREHIAAFDWNVVVRKWEQVFTRLARGSASGS
jgi:glycosyltransferase involved in cell wall biosynthesis